MAEAMQIESQRSERRRVPVAVTAAGGFSGALSCLGAFELLQTLHYLRKCGRLSLANDDPRQVGAREAVCTLAVEGIVSASCGHLESIEAVLALAWWRSGSFSFEPLPSFSSAGAIPLQEILLGAVRLADESEARGAVLPDRRAPLGVRMASAAGALSDVPAASEVVRYLTHHRGGSRFDLEAALPFAPVTLAYALARLCEEGYVGRLLTESRARETEPAATERQALARARSVLRLLLAFLPGARDVAPALVGTLGSELGLAESSHFFDPTGASFLRLRLAPQRFLSITTLPITRRNRFVFESLAASFELAVFLTLGQPDRELDEWLRLAPASITSFQACEGQAAVDLVLDKLRDFEMEAAR
jgi:Domain of unknown function (DUF4388)